MLRKIRGYENYEVREEWKKVWKTGSSIFLFFAMIRTRPRIIKWARRSVCKQRNKLHAELFLKAAGLREFGAVSNTVVE